MIRLNSRRFILGGAGAAALALGVWLLLHRCGGLPGCDAQALPLGPVTAADIKSHPEGHLLYPRAKLYWTIGGAETSDPIEGGTNPAFAGAILTSSGSAGDIFAWYRQWMFSNGWQIDSQRIGSTVCLSYVGFKRGARERFVVAVDDPRLLGDVLGTRVPTDRGTVFEIRYQILPSSS